MGITYIQGKVSGPRGKEASVRFLVDSGARYLPSSRNSLEKIGPETDSQGVFHPR